MLARNCLATFIAVIAMSACQKATTSSNEEATQAALDKTAHSDQTPQSGVPADSNAGWKIETTNSPMDGESITAVKRFQSGGTEVEVGISCYPTVSEKIRGFIRVVGGGSIDPELHTMGDNAWIGVGGRIKYGGTTVTPLGAFYRLDSESGDLRLNMISVIQLPATFLMGSGEQISEGEAFYLGTPNLAGSALRMFPMDLEIISDQKKINIHVDASEVQREALSKCGSNDPMYSYEIGDVRAFMQWKEKWTASFHGLSDQDSYCRTVGNPGQGAISSCSDEVLAAYRQDLQALVESVNYPSDKQRIIDNSGGIVALVSNYDGTLFRSGKWRAMTTGAAPSEVVAQDDTEAVGQEVTAD